MPSRESEVVDYLRADDDLDDLLPGWIYGYMELGILGITNGEATPLVWTGGVFNACAIVRQGAAIPTGGLQSISTKRTSYAQRIAIWVYAKTSDEIEAALKRIYALMMGKRLTATFSAKQDVGGPGIEQAPDLPAGILVHHEDYRVAFIRHATEV